MSRIHFVSHLPPILTRPDCGGKPTQCSRSRMYNDKLRSVDGRITLKQIDSDVVLRHLCGNALASALAFRIIDFGSGLIVWIALKTRPSVWRPTQSCRYAAKLNAEYGANLTQSNYFECVTPEKWSEMSSCGMLIFDYVSAIVWSKWKVHEEIHAAPFSLFVIVESNFNSQWLQHFVNPFIIT